MSNIQHQADVSISFNSNNNNASSYAELHQSVSSKSPDASKNNNNNSSLSRRRNHHNNNNNNNNNNSSSASVSGYFDEDGNYCGSGAHQQNIRIQFANVDPTYGNADAAENLFRIENGDLAREITKRLTDEDIKERAKRMAALREKHAFKKKVPVRSDADVNAYIEAMAQKAEERRKRKLMKVAREMYPDPNPRISEKSKELAEKYRDRQDQKDRIRAKMMEKEQHKLEKKLEHNPNLDASPAQILTKIVEKRHHGHSFMPAGHIEEVPRVYLVSAPTPKVPPSSNSPPRASTEAERQQRFIALSQPRDYQKSEKKQNVSSTSSAARFH